MKERIAFDKSTCPEIRKMILNYPQEGIPKYLYHYTSLVTLFHVFNAFQQPKEQCTPNDMCTFHISSVNSMDDLAEIELYQEVLSRNSNLLSVEKRYEELFILSLSEAEDNMMMWDTYADHGKGVCIELDVEQLLKNPLFYYSEKEEKKQEKWENVKADEHKKQVFLAQCRYNRSNEEFTTYKKQIQDMESTRDFVLKGNILNEVKRYSAIFKKEGYDSEREWRLLVESTNVMFKPHSRLGVTAYTELQIPIKAINSIMIGPRAEEVHRRYLSRLLHDAKGIVPALEEVKVSRMSNKVFR